MGDKMHRFKTLALFATAIIVILTVLAGLTFAADNSSKLAVALINLSAYINTDQYRSSLKDIALVAFALLLLLWRALLLRRSQD
jgi:ABC-type proline/glycine betaine transport system permease subunit